MSVRTCEQCESDEATTECAWCGSAPPATAENEDEAAALPAADTPAPPDAESTVALSVPDEGTVVLASAEENTTVLEILDANKTVQLSVPTNAQVASGSLPRQRGSSPEGPPLDTASVLPGFGPTVTLPVLMQHQLPSRLREATYASVPRLPSPASAEELAAARLRPAPNEDDSEQDPNFKNIVVVFFLALAIAIGAGYLLAHSLSDDIQSFFDSIILSS